MWGRVWQRWQWAAAASGRLAASLVGEGGLAQPWRFHTAVHPHRHHPHTMPQPSASLCSLCPLLPRQIREEYDAMVAHHGELQKSIKALEGIQGWRQEVEQLEQVGCRAWRGW